MRTFVESRTIPNRKSQWAGFAAGVLLLIALIYYLSNLTRWLINDDEGSYLYQVWRMVLGEQPYRDFLTPQLPGFLYAGAALMRWLGTQAGSMRAVAALATIGGIGLFYLALRRLFPPTITLVAIVALLLHPDMFLDGRVFRPEPFMILLLGAGWWATVQGLFDLEKNRRASRPWLVVAGLLFGFATLVKLFSFLVVAGIVGYLLWEALCHQRTWSQMIGDALALLTPYSIVVGGVIGVYWITVPKFYGAVFGHQLMQGATRNRGEVLLKGVEFFIRYLQSYGVMIALAVPVAVWSIRRTDRPVALFAWQLPTALAFLLLSRELFARHLLYLVPSLAVLLAVALYTVLHSPAPRFLWLGLVIGVIAPWAIYSRDVSNRTEDGTVRAAGVIDALTQPGEPVLADLSELNFYAHRPTTYTGAAISAGATQSGQITGATLIAEIEQAGIRLLLLDPGPFGQLQFLHDRQAFLNYVQSKYDLIGTLRREDVQFNVYWKHGQPLPLMANFDNQLGLLGLDRPAIAHAGDNLVVRSAWQSQQVLPEDYVLFAHLLDADDHQVAGIDDSLLASPGRTTTAWQPKELSATRLVVHLPISLLPGDYRLDIGLYRRSDHQHLTIVNATGSPIGPAFTSGVVRIDRPQGTSALRQVDVPNRTNVELLSGVKLAGYELSSPEVQAGNTLPVRLIWQVGQPLRADYRLHWQLLGEGNRSGGEGEADLGSPVYPTSRWQVGDILQTVMDILPNADSPGGAYQVFVSWIGPDGWQSIAFGVSTISVRPLASVMTTPPPIQHLLNVHFGERIRLLGYDLDPKPVPAGGQVNLTLYWQAEGPIRESYKVFTHLLDSSQQLVGQRDQIPVGDTRPTTGWIPGEVIVDRYAIPVQKQTPPGHYQLEAGLYSERNGERLPVVVDRSSDPAGRVALAQVEVK